MKLTEIGKPKGANRKTKRRGLGQASGHGGTSCRGNKGQLSRSGRATYIGYEGGQMPLIRRIPKRGFNNIFSDEFQVVNVSQLNNFKNNDVVDAHSLEEGGLIKGKDCKVKILGDGELKKALIVKANKFSKSAVKKIQGGGGKVEYA